MYNKTLALKRLREFPREKWRTGKLIDSNGNKCALGIIAGEDASYAQSLTCYADYFTPMFGLSDMEIISIYGLNDIAYNLEEVIDFIKKIPYKRKKREKKV